MRRFALIVVSVASLTACGETAPPEVTPLQGDREEPTMTPPDEAVRCETAPVAVFALIEGVSIASGDTIETHDVVHLVTEIEAARYDWTIRNVETGRVVHDAAAEPRFEPQQAGTYEVSLTIESPGCVRVAQPLVFSAETAAPPSPGLTVELTWYTPGDEDAADLHSSDLDLHYRHEAGFWNSDPWDCWRENKAPDWGPSGLPGNPHLLASAFSFRPEILEHKAPEAAFYELGVHYPDDAGFGRSVAIVHVFFNGTLMYEDAATLAPGTFWPVAILEGSTGTVFPHPPESTTTVRH